MKQGQTIQSICQGKDWRVEENEGGGRRAGCKLANLCMPMVSSSVWLSYKVGADFILMLMWAEQYVNMLFVLLGSLIQLLCLFDHMMYAWISFIFQSMFVPQQKTYMSVSAGNQNVSFGK